MTISQQQNSLHQLIKHQRVMRGLTLQEFSAKSGVSSARLGHIAEANAAHLPIFWTCRAFRC